MWCTGKYPEIHEDLVEDPVNLDRLRPSILVQATSYGHQGTFSVIGDSTKKTAVRIQVCL